MRKILLNSGELDGRRTRVTITIDKKYAASGQLVCRLSNSKISNYDND